MAMHDRVIRQCLLLTFGLPLVAGGQQSVTPTLAVMVQQGDTIPDFVRRAATAHPQPGDRVWFHVWREPKLSDTVMVDDPVAPIYQANLVLVRPDTHVAWRGNACSNGREIWRNLLG